MGKYRDRIKQIAPENFHTFINKLPNINIENRINKFFWTTSLTRWISTYRIKHFENRYSGKRCFIIGNGPSLSNTNLSYLKNEYTFGLNRIYLLFPKIGYQTSFYICVNYLVLDQSKNEINRLRMPKFINWNARKMIKMSINTMYLRDSYQGTPLEFSFKPYNRIWEGSTVTYVAMQLAYYMGFSKVILIGVDHSFQSKGQPHQEVVADGEDHDHFDPNYFGKGFRWNLPDLEGSEKAYKLAKSVYESSGREILDATIDGKLQVFKKVDFNSLF